MRAPYTIDTRALAIGFAILGNMAVALSSFPAITILSLLHGVGPSFAEAARLHEAARIAVYFSCIPLLALLAVRLIPVKVVPYIPGDPLYEDVASTFQVGTAITLLAITLVLVVFRLGGVSGGDVLSAFLQVAYFTLAVIYMILLSDGRRPLPWLRLCDRAVMISMIAVCIFFGKRSGLLLVIPLLLAEGGRVRPKWIFLVIAAAAAILVFNMAVRGNLEFTGTIVRVAGNQIKYLERYSLDFGQYNHCFGRPR